MTMNSTHSVTYDGYRLGYGGAVAAALPGFALLFFGGVGLLFGGVASMLLLAAAISMRTALRDFAWYRVYLMLIFASTFLIWFARWMSPTLFPWSALGWGVFVVIVSVLYYERFSEVHGQRMG